MADSFMPVDQVQLLPDGVDALPPGVVHCQSVTAAGSLTRGYSGNQTCFLHDGTSSSMSSALAKAKADAKTDVSGPTVRNEEQRELAEREEREYVDHASRRLGVPKHLVR